MSRPPAVVGSDRLVPLLDGRRVRYVNLDNAASTPPLAAVQAKVDALLPWYASVHRGFGYKSRLCTEVYEEARAIVADFLGAADPQRVVVFTKHTTESINLAAVRIPFRPGEVVLTTVMEHHANLLPWRGRAEVVHVGVHDDGALDLDEFADTLARLRGRVRLVAVTGASNVTGYLPPIHDLAEQAHAAGAEILVDAAQLAPHRPIRMGPPGHPRSLDWLAISGHKLYAPYGAGVLVGPRAVLCQGEPGLRGGGAVRHVSLSRVEWRDPPAREESGSPNLVGVVALAAAARELAPLLDEDGEAALRDELRRRLEGVPGLRVFGPAGADRLGVFAFRLDGVAPALLAAVLSFEYGIGVREGSFCAHPYVARLLGLDAETVDWTRQPGLVRASLGLYNTREDVEALAGALARIGAHGHDGAYREVDGDYVPLGYEDVYREVFSIAGRPD